MARTFLIVGSLCSAALPVLPSSASAKPESRSIAVDDFDLAQTVRVQGSERRYRLSNADRTRVFREDKFKPHWTYSPIDGGPVVELGALGGGRKGRPKLAHVGVDWDF